MTGSRVGRALRGVGKRLSYANVVASLALVVATGGTAYAATLINGHNIVNHSIPADKLVRGAVVPLAGHASTASKAGRAAAAGRVDHLLFTRGRRVAHTASTRPTGHAVLGSPGTVIYLAKGQSVTVFQSGPFTVIARCVAQGSDTSLKLDGVATEDWYPETGLGASDFVKAGVTSRMSDGAHTSVPNYYTDGPGVVGMMGVDGQSIVVGPISVTMNIFGDCTFSGEATTS